jgi:peptidoglycan/xylan/chitin deacetylase (PgdA/CDA1 family)
VPRLSVVVTALAVAVMVVTGCVAGSHRPGSRRASMVAGRGGGAGTGPNPTPSAPTVEPSVAPTTGPTVTPSKPSKPKPPTTPASPRPPAGGAGPAGSTSVTGSSAVALTFDDGPDPTYTPQILDLLKAHGVKATFCLVGFRAATQPDLVRRIVAEGHTLCNHSWQHLFDLGMRSPTDIQRDLRQTNEAIRAAVPDADIKYFRAPGGNFTPILVEIAREFGMNSIYWAVDPRDWDRGTYGSGAPMVNHIISVVEHKIGPGSIVLSHDLNKPDTIAAYRQLLPWLEARFTLIRLPT